MQDDAEAEYVRMKDFLSFYVARYLDVEGLPKEKQPIGSLEALEKKSKKMAFAGLRQAIKDCVGMSSRFDSIEVESLDSQLRSRGIITLSELQKRYSKRQAKA